MSGDKFVALFREMAAGWRSAPRPADAHLPEVTRAGLAEVEAVATVHGWMARVIRSGEAALLLEEAGHGEEASPLVRSMIEHAIGLSWLVDSRGDAVQALRRAHGYEMSRFERSQALGWSVDEQLQERLRQAVEVETDEHTRSLDRLLHVAEQAKEYGLGMLLQAWMVETWTSHASLTSARAYYDHPADPQSGREEIRLFDAPLHPHRDVRGTG